jgi:hypothetical protein
MTFRWMPLPHLTLAEGGAHQLALNVLLYGMTLAFTGTCVWLAALAWLERERT